MKVTVSQNRNIEVDMSNQQLAWAIMTYVQSRLGNIDDAGCDWNTKDNITFIGDNPNEWQVSKSPRIATLINAMNIILEDGRKQWNS